MKKYINNYQIQMKYWMIFIIILFKENHKMVNKIKKIFQ